LKWLNGIGITGQRLNLVSATAYNTLAESSAEAYQTQKELELYYTNLGMAPEQAKLKASEAAAETFWWNAGALVLPNYIQNKFFHGS
jgi:hypothetical protein